MNARDAVLHVGKVRNRPKQRFNGSHWLYTCPQCSPGQRGAITGHHEGIYRCPPVMGPPCGCSGSTRARSAAVAPHLHGCARRRRRGRARGCTAQQVARCADAWCYEHQCHAGGACVALGRRVCAMAQAARLEPAPALHVGAGSIDSESTLERILPKEFILLWQHPDYCWLTVRIKKKKLVYCRKQTA